MDAKGDSIYQELVKYKGVPPIIGSVAVHGLIGTGGMGAVFRGVHLRLRVPVAIKFCYNQPDEKYAEFFEEAMLAAKINNPNVVRVYDVNKDGDFRFIVQEFIDGISAEERLQEAVLTQTPLTEEFALNLAADVARGLASLHSVNFLHLDIKPGNIMICQRNGMCKILDLGLAQRYDPEMYSNGKMGEALAAAGGTPGYASPEQLQMEPVGPPSDIYSLGVCLFELLALQRAFQVSSWFDASEKQTIAELPDIRTFRPEISEATANLIERCVKIRPDERYQSAMELLAAINQASHMRVSRRSNPSDTQVGLKAVQNVSDEPLIFCVDDDAEQCSLLGDLLRRSGYRVETYTEGRKALSKMLGVRPDMVFLDYEMPGICGLEVCKTMRAHVALKNIPVIFLTANADPDSMNLAMIEGATDYLFKPVLAAELIARAQCLARISRAQRELEILERQYGNYRKRLTTMLVGKETK